MRQKVAIFKERNSVCRVAKFFQKVSVQIPVDFEIKGKFLGYIKFKRAVSKQKKMLNFDKETISIVQNDSTGAIIATGELTIVGLPNEFF